MQKLELRPPRDGVPVSRLSPVTHDYALGQRARRASLLCTMTEKIIKKTVGVGRKFILVSARYVTRRHKCKISK